MAAVKSRAIFLFAILQSVFSYVHAQTITVEPYEDCNAIKGAFENAQPGDTVFFKNGTYDVSCFIYVVDKSLVIEGESGETILDGGGEGKGGFSLEDNLPSFVVRNITLTNFQRAFSHTRVGINLGRLVFDNIAVTNSQSGILLSANVSEAWVTNSSFSNIHSSNGRQHSAVYIGHKDKDAASPPDGAGRIHIVDNNFTDLSRDNGVAEFHAILVRGNQANVSGNIIRRFSCNDGRACEAIYAHADRSMVTENSIYDAEGAASIVLKGFSVGSKQSQVRNNLISTSDSVGADFSNNAAIEVQVDNAVVSDNAIYSPRGYAVYEATGKTATQIINNHIYSPRGNFVIRVRGSDAVISGNTILRPAISTNGQVILIRINGTQGKEIDSVIVNENVFIMDGQLIADDLFVVLLSAEQGMSNIIIKDNIANATSVVVNDQLKFIKDNAGTEEVTVNNTLIGIPAE